MVAFTSRGALGVSDVVTQEARDVLTSTSGMLVLRSEPDALAKASMAGWDAVKLSADLQVQQLVSVSNGQMVAEEPSATHRLAATTQSTASSGGVAVGIATRNTIAFIGGVAGDGQPSQQLRLLDPETGLWEEVALHGAALPSEILTATYRVADGAIYAVSQERRHGPRIRALWRIGLEGRTEKLRQWPSLGAMGEVTLTTSDAEELLLTLSGPPSHAHLLIVLRVQSDRSLAPVAFRMGAGRLVGTPHLDGVGASVAIVRHNDVEFDHVARTDLITPCAWSRLQ